MADKAAGTAKTSGRARIGRWMLRGCGVGIVGAFALLLVLVAITPGSADLRRQRDQRPSVLLSAAGDTLRVFSNGTRAWTPRTAIPQHVVDALIATEDHRFYRHGGVDVRRFFGSLLHTAMGDRQGGSTLSMQLARNLYPERIGQAPDLWRKGLEVVTAWKIERAYSKEEVVETYLNTVPFLYGARGIGPAAHTYFSKPASALTVSEGAVLVGMLKGTAAYNPVLRPDRARARRDVVLGQMARHGYLDAAEAERLRQAPMRTRFSPPERRSVRAYHFTEAVRRWLLAWTDDRGFEPERAGLVVHTTLDPALQTLAENAVERQGGGLQAVADVEWGRREAGVVASQPSGYRRLREGTTPWQHFMATQTELVDDWIEETTVFADRVSHGEPPESVLAALRADAAFLDSLRQVKTHLEAGMVAIDPSTGAVRAYVGGRRRFGYDHAGVARRQPGSTFKAFVYAAALEEGYRPGTRVLDAPVEVEQRGGVWRPASTGASGAYVTVAEALAHSKNNVAVRLGEEVGPRRVARMAEAMGVRSSELRAVPSLALGTSEVTVAEMTSAYATIAAGGVYRPPVLVTRIEDAEGRVLYEHQAHEERVLDEQVAADLADMMRGVVDEGTGTRVRSVFGVRCDVAGKTGTSQDGADGWFVLMHPQLVAGAWVGFDDPRVTFRTDHWGQGGHNALYVVSDLFRHALRQGEISPRPYLLGRPPRDDAWEEPEPEERRGWGRWIARRVGGWFGGDGERRADGDDARERRELERQAREIEERAREASREHREEMRRRRAEAERRHAHARRDRLSHSEVERLIERVLRTGDDAAAERLIAHGSRDLLEHIEALDPDGRVERWLDSEEGQEHVDELAEWLADRYVRARDGERRGW